MHRMRSRVLTLSLFLFVVSGACATGGAQNQPTATPRLVAPTNPGQSGTAAAVPFRLRVQEAANKNAPALHSFAMGQHDGKWLLVGGRINGFHRTSTRESGFPSDMANKNIYVMDPRADTAWQMSLPAEVATFLRATNLPFYQDGDVLYIAGGYGSSCDDDKPECYGTFPRLTAIRLPQVIQAIIAGNRNEVARNIVSITDERFRVTGGGLSKLGDDFYLVFGHNYDKVYKGAYTGKYTEAIRRFRVRFDSVGLVVTDYEEFGDPKGASGTNSQYHRRDLNVVATVRPDGEPGITAYGGVFTKTGGAFVNPVYIWRDAQGETKIEVDTGFEQKMSLYECAHLTMFDPPSGTQYTTLFGGISLYYYNEQGELVPSTAEENWMPFIDSITTLARLANGTTVEQPQPRDASLPERLGANAIFVPAPDTPRYGDSHDVLDYSKLPAGNSVLVGHIYGGIRAMEDQVNEANPSFASSKVYEVYLDR